MTLTPGDLAAVSALMITWGAVLAGICRYFVRSEIKIAVDGLRLEWAKERASALEARLLPLHQTES